MEVTHLLLGAWDYLTRRRLQWRPEKDGRSERERLLIRTLSTARGIPFYREKYRSFPPVGGFSLLPVLRRAEIPLLNRSARSLLPAGRAVLSASSSGSTGMPSEFLFDPPHQRSRFACRVRYLWENGWRPLRRTAWILNASRAGTPDGRLMESQLSLGSSFLSVFEPIPNQADWLRRLDPHALYTFPSNLDALLDEMARNGAPRSLKRLFAGAEVLDDPLREKARRVLGLEIAGGYGSTEAFLAWQCPGGSYHVNDDHVLIEILDGRDEPAAPGTLGRVVLTTLRNRVLPLVRYEIGDWAAWSGSACPCGRTSPVLAQIAGRSVNFLRHADGSRVSPWKLVVELRVMPALRQFQVVQKDAGTCLLRYVSPADLPPEGARALEGLFAEMLGFGIRLRLERVEAIPRTPAGKYLTVWSEIEEPVPAG